MKTLGRAKGKDLYSGQHDQPSFVCLSLHHQHQSSISQLSHHQHQLLEKPSLAIMYLTKVSRSVHPPAPHSHSTDILAQFLSVMALAIMGTNAAVAAVAAEPKIGLEERACFCK